MFFKHCETGRTKTKMRFAILDCNEHLVEEPNRIWHQWKCLMHIQAIPRLFFPPLDWEQISTSRKLSKIRWKLLTKLKKKKKFFCYFVHIFITFIFPIESVIWKVSNSIFKYFFLFLFSVEMFSVHGNSFGIALRLSFPCCLLLLTNFCFRHNL